MCRCGSWLFGAVIMFCHRTGSAVDSVMVKTSSCGGT
jgi:hypothetical protein